LLLGQAAAPYRCLSLWQEKRVLLDDESRRLSDAATQAMSEGRWQAAAAILPARQARRAAQWLGAGPSVQPQLTRSSTAAQLGLQSTLTGGTHA
jgi:hypothetical protein